MPTTKILYDIEQLLTAKGKETGICRVSLEVLRHLSQRKDYKVYPLVTTSNGSPAAQYLQSKGLSHLINNIVYLPKLKKTTQNHNLYKRICSALYSWQNNPQYLKELNKYDEYISIFSPISPLVYASKLKTKIVVHDLIPIKFPQFCAAKFANKYRCWLKSLQADEVICVSQATKKDFLAFRPDYLHKPVKVAYLAAGKQFQQQTDRNIKEKYNIKTSKYILAVSDHNPRKNFPHLIKSYIKFLENTDASDISLAIVGPKAGDSAHIFETMAQYRQYQDKIVITGFVSDKDLPALYSSAHMFIYPSLYEGFGLPILEAMSCGCPVICSDNSSLPEVGGTAPLYIKGNNLEETATAISTFYHNTEKQHSATQQGLQQAAKFNWQQTIQQMFSL